MRSYVARLTWSVSTWIILGVAAFFLLQSEREISRRRAALGTFDTGVRATSGALGDVRHTQAAYVATGQNLATWAPRIRLLLHKASESLYKQQASGAGGSSAGSGPAGDTGHARPAEEKAGDVIDAEVVDEGKQ